MSSSNRSAPSPSVPTFLPVLAGLTASGLPLIQTLTSRACIQEHLNSREEKERPLVLFGGLNASGLPLVQGLVYTQIHIPLSTTVSFTVLEREAQRETEENDCIKTISEELDLDLTTKRRSKENEGKREHIAEVEPQVEEFVYRLSGEVVQESIEEANNFIEAFEGGKNTFGELEKSYENKDYSNNQAFELINQNQEYSNFSQPAHSDLETEEEVRHKDFVESSLKNKEQSKNLSEQFETSPVNSGSLRPIEKLEQLENDLRKAFLTETLNPHPISDHHHSGSSTQADHSVQSSNEEFLANFLRKLAHIKMTDEKKYDDVVERLRRLEEDLKITNTGLPPDPEFTDLVSKILKSSYPNADLQIIVNSSRKTTTTKSFYETETPGMVGLNGDQIRDLQVKLMGNISSPGENAANQPDKYAAQHKEVMEEGYSAPDGSEVVSKKMTRVVTTSQSTVSGLDEQAARDEAEKVSLASTGSVRERIAIFEAINEKLKHEKESQPAHKTVEEEHAKHTTIETTTEERYDNKSENKPTSKTSEEFKVYEPEEVFHKNIPQSSKEIIETTIHEAHYTETADQKQAILSKPVEEKYFEEKVEHEMIISTPQTHQEIKPVEEKYFEDTRPTAIESEEIPTSPDRFSNTSSYEAKQEILPQIEAESDTIRRSPLHEIKEIIIAAQEPEVNVQAEALHTPTSPVLESTQSVFGEQPSKEMQLPAKIKMNEYVKERSDESAEEAHPYVSISTPEYDMSTSVEEHTEHTSPINEERKNSPTKVEDYPEKVETPPITETSYPEETYFPEEILGYSEHPQDKHIEEIVYTPLHEIPTSIEEHIEQPSVIISQEKTYIKNFPTEVEEYSEAKISEKNISISEGPYPEETASYVPGEIRDYRERKVEEITDEKQPEEIIRAPIYEIPESTEDQIEHSSVIVCEEKIYIRNFPTNIEDFSEATAKEEHIRTLEGPYPEKTADYVPGEIREYDEKQVEQVVDEYSNELVQTHSHKISTSIEEQIEQPSVIVSEERSYIRTLPATNNRDVEKELLEPELTMEISKQQEMDSEEIYPKEEHSEEGDNSGISDLKLDTSTVGLSAAEEKIQENARSVHQSSEHEAIPSHDEREEPEDSVIYKEEILVEQYESPLEIKRPFPIEEEHAALKEQTTITPMADHDKHKEPEHREDYSDDIDKSAYEKESLIEKHPDEVFRESSIKEHIAEAVAESLVEAHFSELMKKNQDKEEHSSELIQGSDKIQKIPREYPNTLEETSIKPEEIEFQQEEKLFTPTHALRESLDNLALESPLMEEEKMSYVVTESQLIDSQDLPTEFAQPDVTNVILRNIDKPFVLRKIVTIPIYTGPGELVADLVDPEGQPVKVEMVKTAAEEYIISFLPVKLGAYVLDLSLSGEQVPVTPIELFVEEQSHPYLYGSAIDYGAKENHSVSLIFDPRESNGGIKIDIRNPNGEKVRHTTDKRSDGTTEILFLPSQTGIHRVNIDFNNKPIQGSPYQIHVFEDEQLVGDVEEIVTSDIVGQVPTQVVKLSKEEPLSIDGETYPAEHGQEYYGEHPEVHEEQSISVPKMIAGAVMMGAMAIEEKVKAVSGFGHPDSDEYKYTAPSIKHVEESHEGVTSLSEDSRIYEDMPAYSVEEDASQKNEAGELPPQEQWQLEYQKESDYSMTKESLLSEMEERIEREFEMHEEKYQMVESDSIPSAMHEVPEKEQSIEEISHQTIKRKSQFPANEDIEVSEKASGELVETSYEYISEKEDLEEGYVKEDTYKNKPEEQKFEESKNLTLSVSEEIPLEPDKTYVLTDSYVSKDQRPIEEIEQCPSEPENISKTLVEEVLTTATEDLEAYSPKEAKIFVGEQEHDLVESESISIARPAKQEEFYEPIHSDAKHKNGIEVEGYDDKRMEKHLEHHEFVDDIREHNIVESEEVPMEKSEMNLEISTKSVSQPEIWEVQTKHGTVLEEYKKEDDDFTDQKFRESLELNTDADQELEYQYREEYSDEKTKGISVPKMVAGAMVFGAMAIGEKVKSAVSSIGKRDSHGYEAVSKEDVYSDEEEKSYVRENSREEQPLVLYDEAETKAYNERKLLESNEKEEEIPFLIESTKIIDEKIEPESSSTTNMIFSPKILEDEQVQPEYAESEKADSDQPTSSKPTTDFNENEQFIETEELKTIKSTLDGAGLYTSIYESEFAESPIEESYSKERIESGLVESEPIEDVSQFVELKLETDELELKKDEETPSSKISEKESPINEYNLVESESYHIEPNMEPKIESPNQDYTPKSITPEEKEFYEKTTNEFELVESETVDVTSQISEPKLETDELEEKEDKEKYGKRISDEKEGLETDYLIVESESYHDVPREAQKIESPIQDPQAKSTSPDWNVEERHIYEEMEQPEDDISGSEKVSGERAYEEEIIICDSPIAKSSNEKTSEETTYQIIDSESMPIESEHKTRFELEPAKESSTIESYTEAQDLPTEPDVTRVILRNVDRPFVLRKIVTIPIYTGPGELVADLVDPEGQPVKVEMVKTAAEEYIISFLPVKLGAYVLDLSLSGEQVPVTPIELFVEEQSHPYLYGSAIDYGAKENHSVSLIFDPRESNGGIKIDIRNPNGEKVRHTTDKRSDGTTEILFLPSQTGIHRVNIDFNNKPIQGSPYQIHVFEDEQLVGDVEEIVTSDIVGQVPTHPQDVISESEKYSTKDEVLHGAYNQEYGHKYPESEEGDISIPKLLAGAVVLTTMAIGEKVKEAVSSIGKSTKHETEESISEFESNEKSKSLDAARDHSLPLGYEETSTTDKKLVEEHYEEPFAHITHISEGPIAPKDVSNLLERNIGMEKERETQSQVEIVESEEVPEESKFEPIFEFEIPHPVTPIPVEEQEKTSPVSITIEDIPIETYVESEEITYDLDNEGHSETKENEPIASPLTEHVSTSPIEQDEKIEEEYMVDSTEVAEAHQFDDPQIAIKSREPLEDVETSEEQKGMLYEKNLIESETVPSEAVDEGIEKGLFELPYKHELEETVEDIQTHQRDFHEKESLSEEYDVVESEELSLEELHKEPKFEKDSKNSPDIEDLTDSRTTKNESQESSVSRQESILTIIERDPSKQRFELEDFSDGELQHEIATTHDPSDEFFEEENIVQEDPKHTSEQQIAESGETVLELKPSMEYLNEPSEIDHTDEIEYQLVDSEDLHHATEPTFVREKYEKNEKEKDEDFSEEKVERTPSEQKILDEYQLIESDEIPKNEEQEHPKPGSKILDEEYHEELIPSKRESPTHVYDERHSHRAENIPLQEPSSYNEGYSDEYEEPDDSISVPKMVAGAVLAIGEKVKSAVSSIGKHDGSSASYQEIGEQTQPKFDPNEYEILYEMSGGHEEKHMGESKLDAEKELRGEDKSPSISEHASEKTIVLEETSETSFDDLQADVPEDLLEMHRRDTPEQIIAEELLKDNVELSTPMDEAEEKLIQETHLNAPTPEDLLEIHDKEEGTDESNKKEIEDEYEIVDAEEIPIVQESKLESFDKPLSEREATPDELHAETPEDLLEMHEKRSIEDEEKSSTPNSQLIESTEILYKSPEADRIETSNEQESIEVEHGRTTSGLSYEEIEEAQRKFPIGKELSDIQIRSEELVDAALHTVLAEEEPQEVIGSSPFEFVEADDEEPKGDVLPIYDQLESTNVDSQPLTVSHLVPSGLTDLHSRPKSPVPPRFFQQTEAVSETLVEQPESIVEVHRTEKFETDSLNEERGSSSELSVGEATTTAATKKQKHVSIDNLSEGSLQEFERLELELQARREESPSSIEAELEKNGAGSIAGSVNSLTEFENLEREIQENIPDEAMMLSDIREEEEVEEMSTREDDEDENAEPVLRQINPMQVSHYRDEPMITSVDSLELAAANQHLNMETSLDSLGASNQNYTDKDSLLEGVTSQENPSQDTQVLTGDTVGTYQEYQDEDDRDSLNEAIDSYPTTLTTFETVQVLDDGTAAQIIRRVQTRVTDPVHSHVRFTGTEDEDHLRSLPFDETVETVDEEGNITITTCKRAF